MGDKKIDFYQSHSGSESSNKGPYKSSDHYEKVKKEEIHKEDDSSSLNEEEKKEKEQYKLLKKSLKALQERANNTFKPDSLTKNYSVSS